MMKISVGDETTFMHVVVIFVANGIACDIVLVILLSVLAVWFICYCCLH